ncbi:MAG: ECF transporter S component [Clostridiaceae bacterium]
MEARSNKTRKLVYNAMIMAIIIIMSVVPFLGFIQIPPVAVTLVHIPVIIGGILFGLKSSLLFATTFGLSSLFVAMTRGAATDVLFINPMVSVVPRIIFGFAIVLIYNLVKNTNMSEQVKIGITAFLSSFIHSLIVIAALFISMGITDPSGIGSETLKGILATLFTVNVTLEAIVATIVTIPVVIASRKVLKDEQ